MQAWALGISGVNFSPGIRFWEVKFCLGIRFLASFDKKVVIFDKRDKKVTYLPKNSNFGTLKFMKTCPVIRFLGTFLPGHYVFLRIFALPMLCTCRTSIPTFIRELRPPSPQISPNM